MRDGPEEITPELLLRAYANGIFPMAQAADNPEIFWVDPDRRGIFPLGEFHISRSLHRTLRRQPFQITTDRDFTGVVTGCADHDETWINAEIYDLYTRLHQMGRAHSLEVWDGTDLVGGVYGVVLGGAFFGESMFSRRTDASKIALAYLVSRLRFGGFTLFDTQFLTDHLASLGAVEISHAKYHRFLDKALKASADFNAQPARVQPSDVLQDNSHTS
ncbi:MAG: leucyl/phenylalanyl-tRNA--protein transferase [Rhodobacteraceae bacterium]|nr:leucyl/phenylalanyl-tRNA--protein transferase [Paracoccaceae bacterium]